MVRLNELLLYLNEIVTTISSFFRSIDFIVSYQTSIYRLGYLLTISSIYCIAPPTFSCVIVHLCLSAYDSHLFRCTAESPLFEFLFPEYCYITAITFVNE